jgi:hypothetical protein
LQQKPDDKRYTMTKNPHGRVAFQQQLTQADRQRNVIVKWRRLEYAIKHALINQPVTVLFRDNQLVLIDHGADVNKVWAVLQNLHKKYSFAVALHGRSTPAGNIKKPLLLWVHTLTQQDNQRTWTLRESVG